MGSTTKAVTSTSSSAPWAGQQPYLQDGFNIARQDLAAAANGQIGSYYPGQTFTPADWKTNAGVNTLYSIGANGNPQQNQANANTSSLLQNGAGALPGSSALQGYANGDHTGDNPYFQQMVQQSFNAARPALDSAFASSGRLGSGNHDAALANAAYNTAGQLGYQNYTDSQNRQIGAAGVLNNNALSAYNLGQQGAQQSNQAAQQGAQDMLAAGQTTEGYNDKAIQAAIDQWNFNQNKPWNDLSNYMGMIQGNYGGSSTTTQPIVQNQGLAGLGAFSGLLGGLGQAGGKGGIPSLLGYAASGAAGG